MATLTGVAVGDVLGWDGTRWVETNGTTVTNGVLKVTAVDTTKGLVEAVLLG